MPVAPDRVHLIAHANPAAKDIARLGLAGPAEYLAFIRQHTPAPLRITCNRRLLGAAEDQLHGGRRDDRARIRDLQQALDDPRTRAIVALAGGAYFVRLLPHIDLRPLARRRRPILVTGFSEMTPLVGLVASYACGVGVYWLCPNYLAWKIRPRRKALAAFGDFWRNLPALIEQRPFESNYLPGGPITADILAGKPTGGRLRIAGGCLSLLAAVATAPWARRLVPKGHWLLIEDINEPAYRIDRLLATLKLAGWFEHCAGVLIGGFYHQRQDLRSAVFELLRYHLPSRRIPIMTTTLVGHTWPIVPVPLNMSLPIEVSGRRAVIHTPWAASRTV